MIDCKYWKECGIDNGGCCLKHLYGGRPHKNVCEKICKDKEELDKKEYNTNLDKMVQFIKDNKNNYYHSLWKKLHSESLTIDIASTLKWLLDFAILLPCGKCKKHFYQYIKDNPFIGQTNEDLFKWTWVLHNYINENGDYKKPFFPYEEATKLYIRDPIASQEILLGTQ